MKCCFCVVEIAVENALRMGESRRFVKVTFDAIEGPRGSVMVAYAFAVDFVKSRVEVSENGRHGEALARILHTKAKDSASSLGVDAFTEK